MPTCHIYEFLPWPEFPVIIDHGRYVDTCLLLYLFVSSIAVPIMWLGFGVIFVDSTSFSCWSGCVCCWTTRLRLILASDIARGSTADARPGSKFGFNEIWTRYFGAYLGSKYNKWIQIQHWSSVQPSGSWGSFWSLEGRSSKSLAKHIGGSCPCCLSQSRGTLKTKLGTEVSQHSRVRVVWGFIHWHAWSVGQNCAAPVVLPSRKCTAAAIFHQRSNVYQGCVQNIICTYLRKDFIRFQRAKRQTKRI